MPVPYTSSGAFAARLAFGSATIEAMEYVELSNLLGMIRDRARKLAGDEGDPQDYEVEAAQQVRRAYVTTAPTE